MKHDEDGGGTNVHLNELLGVKPVAWLSVTDDRAPLCLRVAKPVFTDGLEVYSDTTVFSGEVPLYPIPRGWKVVPIEPTAAMVEEVIAFAREFYDRNDMDQLGQGEVMSYLRAAVECAPEPPLTPNA